MNKFDAQALQVSPVMRGQLGFTCVASSCAADQPERCKTRFRKLIHSCCRLTAAMEVEAVQGAGCEISPHF